MRSTAISIQLSRPSLERLPVYYSILKEALARNEQFISSETIGREAGVPGAQVRKDLLGFKAKGRPSMGFNVGTLAAILEEYLGLAEGGEAALVGAGNLGKALALFNGFEQYRMKISMLFDNDPRKTGLKVGELEVHPMTDLSEMVRSRGVRIGIITTPAAAAQETAEALVNAGVTALWNFTPVRLALPEAVHVRYENLSAGLALLAHKAFGRS